MTPHAPFLTDEPDSLGADAFGHTDYAETLHSIVTDAQPPLAIGLLGRWGLGKSSIIGALQSREVIYTRGSAAKLKPFADLFGFTSVDDMGRTHATDARQPSLAAALGTQQRAAELNFADR